MDPIPTEDAPILFATLSIIDGVERITPSPIIDASESLPIELPISSRTDR